MSNQDALAWRSRYLDWYRQIEAAHEEFGHPFGFNPLCLSSVSAFAAVPRLLVATLNPAGSVDFPHHRGLFRYEDENAYFIEWEANGLTPLQHQVQAAFDYLRVRSRFGGALYEFARDRVVTAQIVPFRSPDEASLHNREATLNFSRSLWSQVLRVWRPQAVVAISQTTAGELSRVLGNVTYEERAPTGWGNIAITLREFETGTRMVALPHLSRFQIFGRPQSKPHLDAAFDWLMELI